MHDWVEIGCTPAAEDCAQVGADDYWPRARNECLALIDQLRRTFGPEPVGAKLSVKSNPHDFGSYLEVICRYDLLHPDASDYAMRCESELPEHWDSEALAKLGIIRS